MLGAWRTLTARLLPHGWFDAFRQLALFAAAYYAYRIVRGAVDGKAAVAFENARDLIDIERTVGLFIEPSIQAATQSVAVLEDFTSWMYINSHFVVTVATLAYLYLAHNRSFYFVRNMFLVAMGIALVGYVVYPTAPPRFFQEWGFQDSVADFTGLDSSTSSVNALYNPFAAVPSMHVAFALMIALPMARLVKSRALRTIWLVYPLLITYVVIATANHFWLDALFGALTAAGAAYAARALALARPHAWAFDRAHAEAPA